jgi:hypothetical protein
VSQAHDVEELRGALPDEDVELLGPTGIKAW